MRKHKSLKEVNPEHSFVLKTGKTIKSLEDLLSQLKKMDQETFSHHVNDTKNDFASWINDIIKDKTLADSLGLIIKKNEIVNTVKNRITQLKHHKKAAKTIAKVSKQTTKKIKVNIKPLPKVKEGKHKVEVVDQLSHGEWVGNKMTDVAIEVANKVKEIEETRHKFNEKTYLISGINDFFLGLIIGLIMGVILARVLIFWL